MFSDFPNLSYAFMKTFWKALSMSSNKMILINDNLMLLTMTKIFKRNFWVTKCNAEECHSFSQLKFLA